MNVHNLYKVHPILISSAVFIFGLRLSLLLGLGSLSIMHLITHIPWANLGLHFLTSVLTPALVTTSVLLLIARLRVQNLFLYTLGGSFLGSMLAVLISSGISIFILWAGQSTLLWPAIDNGYILLLLTFPEGFCNGAIVSTLTVLRPDLVKTYNDNFYLDGK